MAPRQFHPSATDVPIIIGMVNRKDRNHDIAAWFGFNQGRIKETKDGKYGPPVCPSGTKLFAKGSPGLKGRRLRANLEAILKAHNMDLAGLKQKIQDAIDNYDADEV